MFRPNNPNNPSQGRYSSGEGSPYSDSGGSTPFRSPLHRPRYQSSPRYHTQYGSPFGDPYWHPPGTPRPQRSPHPSQSPRHEFNTYPSPQGGNVDSPYHGNNRRLSDSGRGRGRMLYQGNRDYSSPGGGYSDNNPGNCDDIRLYYSPDMIQDPWAGLKPVPSGT